MKAKPIFNPSILNDGSCRHGNQQAGEEEVEEEGEEGEEDGVCVLLLSVSAMTDRGNAALPSSFIMVAPALIVSVKMTSNDLERQNPGKKAWKD